jgi:hypothetical protein
MSTLSPVDNVLDTQKPTSIALDILPILGNANLKKCHFKELKKITDAQSMSKKTFPEQLIGAVIKQFGICRSGQPY